MPSWTPNTSIADRGYSAKDFRNQIIADEMERVIPPKHNAKDPHEYDQWRYRERQLIECLFVQRSQSDIGKIKHFRRVFSRFDKLVRHYSGFVHLASVLIWLG